MNLKTDLAASKKMIADGLEDWALGIVDGLTAGNPRLQMAGVYMKNGIRNYIAQQSEALNEAIEGAAIFLADKDGNIDIDKLFSDAANMLSEVDEQPFSMGIIHGTMGGGKIRIVIPDNVLARFIFGDMGAICIGKEDLMALRNSLR